MVILNKCFFLSFTTICEKNVNFQPLFEIKWEVHFIRYWALYNGVFCEISLAISGKFLYFLNLPSIYIVIYFSSLDRKPSIESRQYRFSESQSSDLDVKDKRTVDELRDQLSGML